jgi:hypothetical protein
MQYSVMNIDTIYDFLINDAMGARKMFEMSRLTFSAESVTAEAQGDTSVDPVDVTDQQLARSC